MLFQRVESVAVFGGIQRARQLKDRVQIRFGADPKLLGHFAEGAKISAYQIAIDGKRRATAALQA